jgi:TetR/AcrR family tetracycline transcriptional repressor
MAVVRNTRADVVAHAVRVLDEYGLADLTMRRLASELDVRPSALYHHFTNKQALLAAVADELLERSLSPVPGGAWDVRLTAAATGLRDAVLAWRDGAELVATVHAFGLGAARVDAHVEETLQGSGLNEALRRVVTRTVLHYVFGHATAEQTHLQAASAGALESGDDMSWGAGQEFVAGLGLVVDGVRARVAALA